MAGLVVGTAQWPAPHPLHIVGLDEQFYVYEGKVAVSVPVTLTQEDDQTLQVTVSYQVCSTTDCSAPCTFALLVSVQAAEHIGGPGVDNCSREGAFHGMDEGGLSRCGGV